MSGGGAVPFSGLASGLVFLLILMIPLLTTVWAYGDAEKRGKSGCLVAILVLFITWPLGLILWIVFRPEERYTRS